MKIGILTFHCAHNYGAVLQSYALQEKVKDFGCDVEFIDYRPRGLVNGYLPFDKYLFRELSFISKIKMLIRYLFVWRKAKKRYDGFAHFIGSNLKVSPLCSADCLESISTKYDIILFGSDQIWNINITDGDKNYWGGFNCKNVRRISYAASLGNIDEQIVPYLKYLTRFEAIGVREHKTECFLRKNALFNVKTVLDPTFLLSSKEWDKKLNVDILIHANYILVYQLREGQAALRLARKLAKETGSIIVEITGSVTCSFRINSYETISPKDFVSLIKYAKCVVTTSFHGLAFSIIYNRPFYALKLGDGLDDRLYSLLADLDLINRFVDSNNMPVYSGIDYGLVNVKLDVLKRESERFLSESIFC